MRPALPLLILLAFGCGGSSNHENRLAPILQTARADQVAYGGADGSPRLAAYRRKARSIRVLSPTGALDVGVPGTELFRFAVTGGYLLMTVRKDEVDGTEIVDLATLAARFNPGELAIAKDGNRVVWTSPGGYVVEDLATAVRAPLSIGDNDAIIDLRGERLLVVKYGPYHGDGPLNHAYQTRDLAGAKVADLTVPEGYYAPTPRWVNASGTVVGAAVKVGEGGGVFYPSVPMRWSPEGAGSVVPTPQDFGLLGLADDGSILASNGPSYRILRNGAWRALGIYGYTLELSKDGRTVFATDAAQTRAAAYAVAP